MSTFLIRFQALSVRLVDTVIKAHHPDISVFLGFVNLQNNNILEFSVQINSFYFFDT